MWNKVTFGPFIFFSIYKQRSGRSCPLLSGLANNGVSLLKEDEPVVQGLALISNTHGHKANIWVSNKERYKSIGIPSLCPSDPPVEQRRDKVE